MVVVVLGDVVVVLGDGVVVVDVYHDGGVVYHGGGVVYHDGTVVVVEVVYHDGGVVYHEGGVAYHGGAVVVVAEMGVAALTVEDTTTAVSSAMMNKGARMSGFRTSATVSSHNSHAGLREIGASSSSRTGRSVDF